jgi:hypothetical protein
MQPRMPVAKMTGYFAGSITTTQIREAAVR